ncbi:hypothetical protein KI387_031782, partial [Taxus chinensis]
AFGGRGWVTQDDNGGAVKVVVRDNVEGTSWGEGNDMGNDEDTGSGVGIGGRKD